LNLFDAVPAEFFKPLTSKHKKIYAECLQLIYNTYKNELSFGVDKEILLMELEQYFDGISQDELVFDEDDNEVAGDSRSKANAILRRLKSSGWIDFEEANDFRIRVNLYDYAVTVIEAFGKIMASDELEYQSLVSQIHATLHNKEGYSKPYEYIIKRVVDNTEELMVGLKKLNTSIKKNIDSITKDKTAGEIVEDFFLYHKGVGGKAYHRIKTSDNISYFRSGIIEKLNYILNDEKTFDRGVSGCMEIEQITDELDAREWLREKIVGTLYAFRHYDDIILEIDYKHSKYIESAVARAKFLLMNTNNAEGKIARVLAYLSEEFNQDDTLNLNDEIDDTLLQIFNIFPQRYLDGDSLYVVPITNKMDLPEILDSNFGFSEEERELKRLAIKLKSQQRFSRKNINLFVETLLKSSNSILASTIPMESKRDLIKIIFISLYGRDKKSIYHVHPVKQEISMGTFKFQDFTIERHREKNENI